MENDNFENEIWLPISDYPNYQISNYGRVKSLKYRKSNEEHLLKPVNIRGYLAIDLGKGNRKFIHRLVASAFIPNDDIFKTQINHIDENKHNNCADNLEWCDCKYNINYGLHNEKCAKSNLNHPNISKPIKQYSLDGILINIFPSIHEIERQLGFNPSHISECCNGKLKSSHGYIWRYV